MLKSKKLKRNTNVFQRCKKLMDFQGRIKGTDCEAEARSVGMKPDPHIK